MKLFKSFLLSSVALGQEEGSAFTPSGRTLNFDETDLFKKDPLVSLELIEPLYQECEPDPTLCFKNAIAARCRNSGESCAQSDPINNPCDYHCVNECPAGQDSIIVTGASGGKFKKCVDIADIRQMSNFMCSSPDGAVPQFEMQVPKIIRHKYLQDERNYTLVPFFDENTVFESSHCIQTEETKHFIIFRGPLEGREECQINHWIEYEDDSLFDIFTATIGYDDLVGNIGGTQDVVYRKGAHYQFECRVKRSGTVTNDVFPFVDGRRPVTVVSDETETSFEMMRCSDETCSEENANGVIDISPDSTDDPMVWFKVEAQTEGRYAHLRECYYTFENEEGEAFEYDVIQNGCSANEPITVLSESRNSVGFDKFGQVMFMHQEFDTTKVRVSCRVDACLPPSMGVFSCDVESACSGRYDDLYETFSAENNSMKKRKRRATTDGVTITDEAIVEFEVYHPCYLINMGNTASVCPTDPNERCWTKPICQEHKTVLEEILRSGNSSAKTITATAVAVLFMLTL